MLSNCITSIFSPVRTTLLVRQGLRISSLLNCPTTVAVEVGYKRETPSRWELTCTCTLVQTPTPRMQNPQPQDNPLVGSRLAHVRHRTRSQIARALLDAFAVRTCDVPRTHCSSDRTNRVGQNRHAHIKLRMNNKIICPIMGKYAVPSEECGRWMGN